MNVGGPRQVSLLVVLALQAGRAISADVLAELLWENGGSRKALQMAVRRLRQTLEPLAGEDGPVVATVGGGYRLSLPAGALDTQKFDELITQATGALGAGQPARARVLCDEALRLWRGAPLADVGFADFAQPEIRRLEELRLVALETRHEAALELDDEPELVGALASLVAEHPTRERLAEQLMRLLWRAGRSADALAVYGRTRAHLLGELGIEPGPALSALQAEILAGPGSLDSSAAGQGGRQIVQPPFPLGDLIGRERELTELSELLTSASRRRLVTLTGPGGVGKTALALAAAHAVAGEFADGVGWVELAGVARADDVPMAIAAALRIEPIRDETTEEALHRSLAGRGLMLVIDNVEHVLEAASLIGRLLAASAGLVVLATSREQLGLGGERRLPVSLLALPANPDRPTSDEVEAAPACRLFLEAVRQRGLDFEVSEQTAGAVTRICQQLDGLPLALELAASRAHLMGVEKLALGLSDLGPAPRDAPARHRTLEATIDWSVRLLSPSEYSTYARFAVFAGGASLEAATTIVETDLGALQSLVEKQLLTARVMADGSPRLVMLETIRQDALRRLDQSASREETRRRHVDWYLQAVRAAARGFRTPAESEALHAVDGEIDNIRAALEWSAVHAPPMALELAVALDEYWAIRHDRTGLEWVDTALAQSDDDLDPTLLAGAQLIRCAQFAMRNQFPQALAAAQCALGFFRQIGDQRGIADAVLRLGLAASLSNQSARARRCAEAAARHAEAAGAEHTHGVALARLASELPHGEREPVIAKAIERLTGLGDVRGLVEAYNNVAWAALLDDDIHEADAYLRAAEPLIATASPYWRMRLLGNLGLARLFTNDSVAAHSAFQQQLELCIEHGYQTSIGEPVVGIAAVAAICGDAASASRLFTAGRNAAARAARLEPVIDRRIKRRYIDPLRHQVVEDRWRAWEREAREISRERLPAYALETSSRLDARPHKRDSSSQPIGSSRKRPSRRRT